MMGIATPVLIVIAHPDDECFMGGTIARLSIEGHAVYVGALADGVTSRKAIEGQRRFPHQAADMRQRAERALKAAQALGCVFLNGHRLWPDQRLDQVPVLTLTQQIEKWIAQAQPTIVFTHASGDLNADHRRVHDAVLPAVRPKSGVREVYAFAGPRMVRFEPTVFWALSEDQIARQDVAMACYEGELDAERELVKARAVEYGYQAGCAFAEGFEVMRVVR